MSLKRRQRRKFRAAVDRAERRLREIGFIEATSWRDRRILGRKSVDTARRMLARLKLPRTLNFTVMLVVGGQRIVGDSMFRYEDPKLLGKWRSDVQAGQVGTIIIEGQHK